MPRITRRRLLSANALGPQAQPRPSHRRPLLDLLKTLVYAAIMLVISSTLIARYEIEQTSMEPNVRPGQRVIVSQIGRAYGSIIERSAYAAHSGPVSAAGLNRGQIVVFYETDDRTVAPLIKRLIGLPGDQVSIRDGVVFVNASPLREPYLAAATACSGYCDLTLGPAEYFFLGDNRPVSRDSRQFGPVAGDQVIGRVVARFWPLDKITLFP